MQGFRLSPFSLALGDFIVDPLFKNSNRTNMLLDVSWKRKEIVIIIHVSPGCPEQDGLPLYHNNKQYDIWKCVWIFETDSDDCVEWKNRHTCTHFIIFITQNISCDIWVNVALYSLFPDTGIQVWTRRIQKHHSLQFCLRLQLFSKCPWVKSKARNIPVTLINYILRLVMIC